MPDERLPWFPCEQSKLLAALSGMKPHVGYTYVIVCLRCYEEGGACPDTLDTIARRTGYSKRVVTEALDVLFRAGKLVREAAGIVNPYAAKVIAGIRLRREGHVAAGREGANRRWEKPQSKQRNGHSNATVSPIANNGYLDLHLEEDKKETDSRAVAIASRVNVEKEFDTFWKTYPHRDGANPRKPALEKFSQLVKRGIDPAQIIGGTRVYAEAESARVGTRFIVTAIVFLNQERFNDYKPPPSPTSGPSKPPASGLPTDAELRKRYADRGKDELTPTEG